MTQLTGAMVLVSYFFAIFKHLRINIILNALLIFGLFSFPAMGVAGAALATVISRGIELLLAVGSSFLPGHVPLRAEHFFVRNTAFSKVYWSRTLPVFCNELVWGFGTSMVSVILGHLGSDVVAANAIASIVRNLTSCLIMGVCSGNGIMVGHELGAEKFETAKEYGHRLCIVAFVLGLLMGGLILVCSPLIISLSNITPQAAVYLRWMLIISSYYLVAQSMNATAISGIFCAGGDSGFGLICDIISWWVIVVPLGLILSFVVHAPVPVILVVLFSDELYKLLPVWLHYHKYWWLKNII
ncbi:MAG: hypothetical protein E7294_14360 [Lachnospiraceae bacterium]|nr:hypothetical protein [Lachnospiraceae bacterium]